MLYQWLEEDLNMREVEKLTGKPVKVFRKGNIETGQFLDDVDGNGMAIKIPITRRGIEIDFEGEPTTPDLQKLDRLLSPRKRQ